MSTTLLLDTSTSFDLRDDIFLTPEMVPDWKRAYRLAQAESPVLITGESGTGKTLLAEEMHEMSPRRNFPYVAVNCGSLNKELIANEIFGHEKGGYTGATQNSLGLLREANKGTIFLDEIGDLPETTQAMILTFLDSSKFRPVGSSKEIECDVRLITATNQDLQARIANKSFRDDLYYRLSAYSVYMPPLRSYKARIPELTRHLMANDHEIRKFGIRAIDDSACKFLTHLSWPGNIRQLKQTLKEMAANCTDGDTLGLKDIPARLLPGGSFESSGSVGSLTGTNPDEALNQFMDLLVSIARPTLDQLLQSYILTILKISEGNVAAASRIAKTHRPRIYAMMEKYGLSHLVGKKKRWNMVIEPVHPDTTEGD